MENIEVNSTEEITLFSDDEKVVLREIDFELEQTAKMRGFYNKLTIFNGSYCYQHIKSKHQRKIKFRIDISYLNPLPTRKRKVAWKWLFAAVPFLLVSFVMAYAGILSVSFKPSTYFVTVLIGVFSIALICVLMTVNRSYDKWVYKTDCGGVDLIELLNKQPDTNTFKIFTDLLTLQIRKAKLAKNRPLSECLAGELRELRRLKDETVITIQEYESAKQLIFKHDGFNNSSANQ